MKHEIDNFDEKDYLTFAKELHSIMSYHFYQDRHKNI